jgi:hypothetical protein
MRLKDILGEPEELENVKDWKYAGRTHGPQIDTLDPNREPSEDEKWCEITQYRRFAKKEEVCLRHLMNTDGQVLVSVKGLMYCPDCGAPVIDEED